jgi:MtN3 and saliva related transmembrane protein
MSETFGRNDVTAAQNARSRYDREGRRTTMIIVGLLAAVLTTGSWIPQLVRVWRTRSTDDLSWGYLGTFASGVFLWLVYGIDREDPAIILANGFTFAAVLGVIELKRRGPRPAGRSA